MNYGTLTFLKGVIIVLGLTVLLLSVFWLPVIAEDAAVMNPEYAHLQYPVLFGLYMTVIPFFFALYEAWKLLIRVQQKNAFSEVSITSLGNIKKYALLIIVLYIFGMFFLVFQNALHPGLFIMRLVIIFTSCVISFFSEVLKELLRSALDIKSENDLTI